MLDKMETYAKHCGQVCGNKLLILQAESRASSFEVEKVKNIYEAAIWISLLHGRDIEQAQANELMGKYLSFIVDISGSSRCFKKAYNATMWVLTIHV